jgi:VanZ family protein
LGKPNQFQFSFGLRRRRQPGLLCAVQNGRAFVKYWLPVLAWMALIFTASSDTMSFERSSRIIAPILRWLFPHLSGDSVGLIVLIARKCAHLTEFAVLAWLFWRALRRPVKRDPRPWQWAEARLALFCVMLYAASDEFHQLFVPSRQARVLDVLIDTSGAVLGLLLLWTIARWRKRP